MSAQPPDAEIEKLLEELHSDAAFRRKAAAEKIAELRLSNEEVINALKTMAEADAVRPVRKAAVNALKSLNSPLLAKFAMLLSRRSKITQFTIGFVGWFLVNVGLAFLWGGPSLAKYGQVYGPGPGVSIGLLLFPANILLFFILVRVWRWVALGMLSAIALNLLIALILGIAVAGWCFIPFFTPGLL